MGEMAKVGGLRLAGKATHEVGGFKRGGAEHERTYVSPGSDNMGRLTGRASTAEGKSLKTR